ncbi:MAG: Sua5/YciO/YrdC/YwlC family protein [Candidatus Paceibacterota bacterium]|jgi:tRNA threonylcarbamoyl adenosine modification protein (Sua5/YciO/YrdC/YwlC family)
MDMSINSKIIDKKTALEKASDLIAKIKSGAIFIYPTDTIYGIGCDATNKNSVIKIREIKQRAEQPFSVIAPNKGWIWENCKITSDEQKDIDQKLPGNYTFFIETLKSNSVSSAINPSENNSTLGVRIPKHWFTEIVQTSNTPFVTTSVNITGGKFMNDLPDLDIAIIEKVDIIVYDGPGSGHVSEKIDLRKNKLV